MARRIFLHIGVPKTGTTFLQTVMWHNKRVLKEQGVLYPGESRMDHYHATRAVGGVPEERMGADADAWRLLLEELDAWPETGVITHEFFSRVRRRRARQALRQLAPAEVHLVLTARDYARQFPAVWQEALKMNSDLSFDEFMRRALDFDLPGAWGWRTQDVAAVLDRWGKLLPPERVHVITVPRPGAPRDLLWRRWCHVLGLDPDRFDLDVAVENESLGAAQAALVHRTKPHLTELFDDGLQRHRWFRQYLGHEVLVPQRGERFTLRPDHWSELRELSQQAVKAIDEAGYDVTGDLAELVPDEHPPQRPHPDDVTDAEIVEVAAKAIEQMVRDVRTLTLERRELKRKLAVAKRRVGRARANGNRSDGNRSLDALPPPVRKAGAWVRRRMQRTRS